MDRPNAPHYSPAEGYAFASRKILQLSYDEDRCIRRCMHTQSAGGARDEKRALMTHIRRSVYMQIRFHGHEVKLGEAVRLHYAWSMRLSLTKASEIAGVHPGIVSGRFAYCRPVCSPVLVSTHCQIGGEGHTVEIDETSLAKKQIYHRGRAYHDYWLFCGVDCTVGQWFGHIVFGKRTKANNLPVIKDTTIVSASYASYACGRGGKLHTRQQSLPYQQKL
ncbi:hypothetical protein PHPALM_28337 [Phytophthora palmivora]|uniref:Uncharacterized protein n=1 Tax=Phytophthora palmivora TaxID=4796 RepID=A0A2P4XAC0_9STRA|nr:hypothetical protein PHPALM_28337 [Phytophthora palmivora]